MQAWQSDIDHLRLSTPYTEYARPKICRSVEAKKPCHWPDCPFAHSSEQLVQFTMQWSARGVNKDNNSRGPNHEERKAGMKNERVTLAAIVRRIRDSSTQSCDFGHLGGDLGNDPELRPIVEACGGIRKFVERYPAQLKVVGDRVACHEPSSDAPAVFQATAVLVTMPFDLSSLADVLSNRAFPKIWHRETGNKETVAQICLLGPSTKLTKMLGSFVGNRRVQLYQLLVLLRTELEHTVSLFSLRSYIQLFPGHWKMERESNERAEPTDYISIVTSTAPAEFGTYTGTREPEMCPWGDCGLARCEFAHSDVQLAEWMHHWKQEQTCSQDKETVAEIPGCPPANQTCEICIECRADRQLNPCGHVLCRTCLDAWKHQTITKEQHKGTLCPFCREPLQSTEPVPLLVDHTQLMLGEFHKTNIAGTPERKGRSHVTQLCELTIADVSSLLASVNLVKYAAAFEEAPVDGAILVECEDADLKELGIAFAPHRKRLLSEITRLKTAGFTCPCTATSIMGIAADFDCDSAEESDVDESTLYE
jgi:hypothetical protein